MDITLTIPTKAQIINSGFYLKVADEGVVWSKSQLGDYQDKKGVYILHSNGKILYIGKTTAEGNYGNFGERLRRHFHKKAAQDSPIFKLLLSQKNDIKAYLLDLDDIDMMINQGPISLSQERKALIMEQVLIGIYLPEGNKV